MLIQDLYERYSGLAFTKPSDQPVAILGLQERLAKAFGTQAAYGCFAVYFARGILWKRRDEKRMKPIVMPASRPVPSWSFFSKEGPIKYLELKFSEIDWAIEDFENPLNRPRTAGSEKSAGLGDGGDWATLPGLARKIIMPQKDMKYNITFDEEGEFKVNDLRCVVFGRDKIKSASEELKYHVLVIQKDRRALEPDIYRRVGVASLKPVHVANEGSWVKIM